MIKFLKQNQLEKNAIPFYILSSNMLFKEDCWITKKKKAMHYLSFSSFSSFFGTKKILHTSDLFKLKR